MADAKKIDFLDPTVIATFIAAAMSDFLFIGAIALLIPGIGFMIAAGFLIVHYVTAGIVAMMLWKKIRGLFADLVFILCLILPGPTLFIGIIAGIILSNKVVAFVAETVAIQAIAAASGGAGEALEGAAVATEGAEVAAEGVEIAAEGAQAAGEMGEVAAETGEAAAEAGEAVAEEGAEAGAEAAERAMEGAAEQPPMENLEEEMFNKVPEEAPEAPAPEPEAEPGAEPEPEAEPKESERPEGEEDKETPEEKAKRLLNKGHEMADRLDQNKDEGEGADEDGEGWQQAT